MAFIWRKRVGPQNAKIVSNLENDRRITELAWSGVKVYNVGET